MSCIGGYPPKLFDAYKTLHDKVARFVKAQYGSVAVFEHGRFGQSVFHSHVYFLPFTGSTIDIVPEGAEKLTPLQGIADLRTIHRRDGGYLFFAIGESMWTVDTKLTASRFFRDRFARALGAPERGDWKAMCQNAAIMRTVTVKNAATLKAWQQFTNAED